MTDLITRKKTRGQGMVEFALALPVLLLAAFWHHRVRQAAAGLAGGAEFGALWDSLCGHRRI